VIPVVVTGIGLVSALGASLEVAWHNLLAGSSAIKLAQPFATPPLPLAIIGKQPASLEILTELVVASALIDAKLTPPLLDCGVVIGSSRAYQGRWEQMARQLQGVAGEGLENWLTTLPHMNAIAVARQIQTTGPVLAPMAACATGIWALAQATMLIQTGQCQRVIAGAVDSPITPLVIAGFAQMGALAKRSAYPFDLHREGLVLGEGGAVFVLESAELAQARGAKIYGQILGFGLTADAYHPNQPDPQGLSATAAIKQCLHQSRIAPQEINYIHAHGTATQLNDKIESQLIQVLFPDVAVSSTKGATGHTLGASGALGVAFSLMALKHQILPPCVGLRQPEFDLNFVTHAQQKIIQRVLCLSFGFGGQNAAIALAR
jgi:3-oxoacyl-[acyl-carrier-protein] synthase II